MAYEYVKQYYGVPVEIGQRVSMEGHRPEYGTVVRKREYDQYVHVRFDGHKFDVPVHPLDLKYLTPDEVEVSG
jgi:hypothetical protein